MTSNQQLPWALNYQRAPAQFNNGHLQPSQAQQQQFRSQAIDQAPVFLPMQLGGTNAVRRYDESQGYLTQRNKPDFASNALFMVSEEGNEHALLLLKPQASAELANGYRTPPSKASSRRARLNLLERSPIVGENHICLSPPGEKENRHGYACHQENELMSSIIKPSLPVHRAMLQAMGDYKLGTDGAGEHNRHPSKTMVATDEQFCPVHSQHGFNPEHAAPTDELKADMTGKLSMALGGYPQSRQLGRSRVRGAVAPATSRRCTCRHQTSQKKVSTCEAPLKRHRQVTKQRKCSLVASTSQEPEEVDEDEAELNAIISSDKSCRQLFSDKKKQPLQVQQQQRHAHSSFPSKAQRMSNFGAAAMALVAEAVEEDYQEGSDEQERYERMYRKFSKDDDSQLGDENNDVSCFLDILKGSEAYSETAAAAAMGNSENAINQFESQLAESVNLRTENISLQIPSPSLKTVEQKAAAQMSRNEALELVRAVSLQFAATFQNYYNTKDAQVLDLFTSDASFTLLVEQGPSAVSPTKERAMTTFEAISLMDTEGISQLQLSQETLQIDYDQMSGLQLFYATFDGACKHVAQGAKTFRISFMLGNVQEPDNQTNFKVLATKMQFM